jgi:hypothetical protein
MDREKLEALLRSLKDELSGARSLDPESRSSLSASIAEIRRLIHAQPRTEEVQSLRDRLESIVLRYEAEHPALTAVIQALLDVLAKAGI